LDANQVCGTFAGRKLLAIALTQVAESLARTKSGYVEFYPDREDDIGDPIVGVVIDSPEEVLKLERQLLDVQEVQVA
jgi:hypothetical protein